MELEKGKSPPFTGRFCKTILRQTGNRGGGGDGVRGVRGEEDGMVFFSRFRIN